MNHIISTSWSLNILETSTDYRSLIKNNDFSEKKTPQSLVYNMTDPTGHTLFNMVTWPLVTWTCCRCPSWPVVLLIGIRGTILGTQNTVLSLIVSWLWSCPLLLHVIDDPIKVRCTVYMLWVIIYQNKVYILLVLYRI